MTKRTKNSYQNLRERQPGVSEIRARLNSQLRGLADAELTPEIRTEQTGLVNEFGSVDGELVELRTSRTRAALIAEGNEESEKRGEFAPIRLTVSPPKQGRCCARFQLPTTCLLLPVALAWPGLRLS